MTRTLFFIESIKTENFAQVVALLERLEVLGTTKYCSYNKLTWYLDSTIVICLVHVFVARAI